MKLFQTNKLVVARNRSVRVLTGGDSFSGKTASVKRAVSGKKCSCENATKASDGGSFWSLVNPCSIAHFIANAALFFPSLISRAGYARGRFFAAKFLWFPASSQNAACKFCAVFIEVSGCFHNFIRSLSFASLRSTEINLANPFKMSTGEMV